MLVNGSVNVRVGGCVQQYERMPFAGMAGAQMPVSRIPIARMSVTRTLVARMPVSRMPVARMPVAGMPVAEMPVAGMPVARMPISLIPVARMPVVQPRRRWQLSFCIFCKTNQEPIAYYRSHTLKDPEGRVVCPILRSYVCPICSATGDNAHTVLYCNMRRRIFPQSFNPR